MSESLSHTRLTAFYMHRRSVQCFADISSRAASSSKRVVVPDSLSQCRHASTQALGKGKFTAISSSQLKDVAKLLVKQEKPKGKDTKKKGAATKKPQVVVDSAGAKRLDSGGVNKLRSDIFLPEKSEFLSPRQDDPWQADIELSGEESAGKYDISRGTFLEVRRYVVHGLALQSSVLNLLIKKQYHCAFNRCRGRPVRWALDDHGSHKHRRGLAVS